MWIVGPSNKFAMEVMVGLGDWPEYTILLVVLLG